MASGESTISHRLPLCRAIVCPSSAIRRTIGAVSSVMWWSIRKNVARTPVSRNASRSGGVHVALGPSSKVRYTVGGRPCAGIRHSDCDGRNASIKKGNGSICAATTAPMTIRNSGSISSLASLTVASAFRRKRWIRHKTSG